MDLIAFADDLTLVVWDSDVVRATSRLQSLSRKVITTLREILLDVNAAKSTFMILCIKTVITLKVDNISLEPKNVHKYLGIWFDNKLKWVEHIHQKCQDAVRKTMAIKRYLSLTWGLDNRRLMVFLQSRNTSHYNLRLCCLG